MYKVICRCKENIQFYSETEYFKTKKDAKNFIKAEKKTDKVLYNPYGTHFKYRIVEM